MISSPSPSSFLSIPVMMGCGVCPAVGTACERTLNLKHSVPQEALTLCDLGNRKLRSKGFFAAYALHTISEPWEEKKRPDFRDAGKPNGGSEKRVPLPVTYLFFWDWWGAETNEDDDDRSEDTEDEGKVEVVQVL